MISRRRGRVPVALAAAVASLAAIGVLGLVLSAQWAIQPRGRRDGLR